MPHMPNTSPRAILRHQVRVAMSDINCKSIRHNGDADVTTAASFDVSRLASRSCASSENLLILRSTCTWSLRRLSLADGCARSSKNSIMSARTANSSWWCQSPVPDRSMTRKASFVSRRAKLASGAVFLAVTQGVVLTEVLRENDRQTRCVAGRDCDC